MHDRLHPDEHPEPARALIGEEAVLVRGHVPVPDRIHERWTVGGWVERGDVNEEDEGDVDEEEDLVECVEVGFEGHCDDDIGRDGLWN